MTVRITRNYRFVASHRLHLDHLSEEANQKLFGKCNNPYGHGHNYVVSITVHGPIDERTGLAVSLADLDTLVQREVIEQMDHRNLNLEVEILREINPTAENIVVACWHAIAPHVGPASLSRLRLWETENNYVEYSGH